MKKTHVLLKLLLNLNLMRVLNSSKSSIWTLLKHPSDRKEGSHKLNHDHILLLLNISKVIYNYEGTPF